MNSVTETSGTTDRTYNDQNQLTGVGLTTLNYDHNGNTVRRRENRKRN